MDLSNKCFSQRFFSNGCLFHHSQTYIMCLHLFQVFHFGCAYYLTEKEQYFSLTISESITLDVVTVEIEVEHEFPPQPFFVIFRKWLKI